jgi:hypothetical protein
MGNGFCSETRTYDRGGLYDRAARPRQGSFEPDDADRLRVDLDAGLVAGDRHLHVCAVLSTVYHQRSRIFLYRHLFAVVGTLGAALLFIVANQSGTAFFPERDAL